MAQTASVVNSTLLAIYSGGTKIAHATGAGMSLGMETRDITSKDSAGWKQVLEGLRSGSFSFEGNFTFDSAYGFEDLFALVNSRSSVSVKISTANAADREYSATCYITSLELSSPGSEDNATYSAEFEVNGAVTEATIA